MDKLNEINISANSTYDANPKSPYHLLNINSGLFISTTTASSTSRIKRPDSTIVDFPEDVIAAVHSHFDKKLAHAISPELPLPPWENPANPDPSKAPPRGSHHYPRRNDNS
jgi:hypothetical protein